MTARKLAFFFVFAGGCSDVAGWSGTPDMWPGQDCMACHSAGGLASGRQWTVAGTVFPAPDAPPDAGVANAEVLVTDANGTALTLLTNSAGNFYTAETLQPPIHVEVQYGGKRMRMAEPPPATGPGGTAVSCNACHVLPPPQVPPVANFLPAPGRIFVPIESDGGSE